MIEISDLSVVRSGKPVLSGVGFVARAGELTAICGPNGSGKTTLMTAIAGGLPYRGSIRLGGEEVATLKPWQLAALRGVLPQASVLSFPFTVLEILRMGLEASGWNTSGTATRTIADALAAVDLDGFEGRLYQELSGGEQQRVQFARVLCQIPKPVADGRSCWLLLDEPVSSLDISHQLTIMRLARRFCEAGGGVIAVMHDLNLTTLFADRIALLTAGGLLAAGAIADVVTDDRLAAAFGCRLAVNQTPKAGEIFVLPHSAV